MQAGERAKGHVDTDDDEPVARADARRAVDTEEKVAFDGLERVAGVGLERTRRPADREAPGLGEQPPEALLVRQRRVLRRLPMFGLTQSIYLCNS